MPNPWPGYAKLARMLNRARVDCRKLHTFNMDEYASDDGRIAPETWAFGFMHACKKYFVRSSIRSSVRQRKTFRGRPKKISNSAARCSPTSAVPTFATVALAGRDTLHSSIQTRPNLLPLHSMSGNEWGRASAGIIRLRSRRIRAREFRDERRSRRRATKSCDDRSRRSDRRKAPYPMRAITVDGSIASWQRFTTRLVLHGPVTPQVPESILQTLRTDVWVSESLAADIAPRWDMGY